MVPITSQATENSGMKQPLPTNPVLVQQPIQHNFSAINNQIYVAQSQFSSPNQSFQIVNNTPNAFKDFSEQHQISSDEQFARELHSSLNGVTHSPPVPQMVPLSFVHIPLPKVEDLIFLILGGNLCAISKLDAQEVWRVSLSVGIFGSSVPSILATKERLFVGLVGKVLCLNPINGSTLWENTLKGLDYNYVTMTLAKN